MNLFLSALRLGFRQMFRRPGESATAVVVLALGIGLAATGWAVVWGTYLRPVPVPDGDRLVRISVPDDATDHMPAFDYAAYKTLSAELDGLRSVDRLEAWAPLGFDVSGLPGPSVRVSGASVSAGLLHLTGARPLAGRLIDESDVETGAQVAVVSEEFWRDHLASTPLAEAPGVVVYGLRYDIVGVLPPGLKFPYNQQLFLPEREGLIDVGWMQVLGRLAEGSEPPAAAAEIGAALSRIEGAEGAPSEAVSARVEVESLRDTYHDDDMRTGVLAAAGAAVGILLLACANVANLLLARGLRRQREMAVRTSLGARRRQLVGQLLTETSILALAGGLGGVLLCQLGIQLWGVATADFGTPFWSAVRIDPQVLVMIAAFVVTSCVAAGLLPAWRQSGLHSVATTAQRATGRSGADRWLVVAQVAGSVALLATCAVLIRTLDRLEEGREHLKQADVLTFNLSILDQSGSPDRPSHELWATILGELESLPEVATAAMSKQMPEDGAGWDGRAAVPGDEQIDVRFGVLSSGVYRTLGGRIVAGREFDATDRHSGEPAALVDEDLARALFPGLRPEEVVGRTIRFGQAGPRFDEFPQRTIVGVVADLGPGRQPSLPEAASGTESRTPQAYLPLAQTETTGGRLFVKMNAVAPDTERRLATAVERAAPGHPINNLRPLGYLVDSEMTAQASARTAFTVLALVALALAAAGLYGVLAIQVARRRRELAVRTALGATPGDLLRRVLGSGLALVAIGCAAGLVLAFWSIRAIRSLLHGIEPWDPAALAAALTVLLLSGFVASWIPARRASRVQPASALREE